MSNFTNDARQALRFVRRAPSFSFAIIFLLSAGVALAAISVALLRSYLIRPLPYPDSDRVVQILADESRAFANAPRGLESLDFATMHDAFIETAAWDLDGFTVTGNDQPEFVDGAWVNADFFTIVGARPLIGRLLTADDVRARARVAVISHDYWQRRFGGRADVVGTTLRAYSTDRPLSGDVFTIVGVLAPDFWHINTFTDILAPLAAPRLPSLARLAQGVTIEAAREQLNRAARSAFPAAAQEWRMGLVSVQDEYALQIRPTLLLLSAAVACVLLVACANLAGLLMVRGTSRRHEFAVRAALGAGSGRLVRQQLAEGLILATAAAAGSAWCTFMAIDIVVPWMETQLDLRIPGGAGAARLDAPLMAFIVTTAVTAGVLTSLRPAFGLARIGRESPMFSASRGEATGHGRFRAAMVIGQVAVSFLLLAGAGLMAQTLLALGRTDLGFDPRGVLKGHVLLPQARYSDPPARTAAVRDVLGRIGLLPGVDVASTVMPHPFRFQGSQPLIVETVESNTQRAVHHVVGGDYWQTMSISVIEGRPFDVRDAAGAPPVAIVSQGLARRVWQDRSAIGQRIKTSSAPSAPWLTVVGVVEDVRKTFAQPLVGDTYVPYEQAPGGYLALLVRSSGDPLQLAQPIQRQLASVAPDLPLHEVEAMTTVVDRQAGQRRFLATLLGAFSTIATAIALVGLYVVLSFTVAMRRREIAVRVALGATQLQIGGAVVREGLMFVAIGLVVGGALCVGGARAIASQLYGVTTFDTGTYVLAAVVLGVVSALAASVPALGATRVPVIDVLRLE